MHMLPDRPWAAGPNGSSCRYQTNRELEAAKLGICESALVDLKIECIVTMVG